jgi:hypothetical protein
VGSCDHGNEPSDSIKGGEFLDRLVVSFSRTLLHGVGWLVGWFVCWLVNYLV